jgi:hypothetical protein
MILALTRKYAFVSVVGMWGHDINAFDAVKRFIVARA